MNETYNTLDKDILSDLVGKLVEVETDKRFFYHGMLIKINDEFININDIKNGSMFINKRFIKNIKVMGRIDIMILSSKSNLTFWNKIKLGEQKIDNDINKLENAIFKKSKVDKNG